MRNLLLRTGRESDFVFCSLPRRQHKARRPGEPEGVSRRIADAREANLHPHAHTHSSHHRCRRAGDVGACCCCPRPRPRPRLFFFFFRLHISQIRER